MKEAISEDGEERRQRFRSNRVVLMWKSGGDGGRPETSSCRRRRLTTPVSTSVFVLFGCWTVSLELAHLTSALPPPHVALYRFDWFFFHENLPNVSFYNAKHTFVGCFQKILQIIDFGQKFTIRQSWLLFSFGYFICFSESSNFFHFEMG